ncbi:MAG: GIY-YIG nuclease family protein [Clostridiales bacterium]|nr:GIY-YIG nuclease family protein [Clostridiales bacterium]
MEWLYGGIYKVNSVKTTTNGKFEYDTTLTDVGEEFIGRAIIYYKRQFRQSYCCLERYIDALEVIELRRDSYEIPFPGYDKVNLSWNELSAVINTAPWKTALSNQKGIYLITDASNGKKYVGSATGNQMIWGRWKSYIENGHGGNKDLKNLSLNHIKQYFSYSILEIYKATTDDEVILEREQWWKGVLLSRGKFGYNKN